MNPFRAPRADEDEPEPVVEIPGFGDLGMKSFVLACLLGLALLVAFLALRVSIAEIEVDHAAAISAMGVVFIIDRAQERASGASGHA